MISITTFRRRNVAVLGLGASGRVAAQALAAGGADVVAWDDSEAAVEAARSVGITVSDLRIADWQQFAALVLSPGVPLTHPEPHWSVVSAQAAGVPVIGDIELFARERLSHAPQAPLVTVTGTNGKSTTVALIDHILRAANWESALGGNFGTSALELEPPQSGRVHVLEASSYQIDLAPSLAPTIGVLLNLSPDHLDRHGTMASYARIKERLVAAAETAVVGVDDNWAQAIADGLESRGRDIVRISSRRPLARGMYAARDAIFSVDDGATTEVARIGGIGTLRGGHNAQNAVAAVAVTRALGLEESAIRSALLTFPGLVHRMEEVGHRDRVLFINDSKATNANAAAKALSSFRNIFWIAGGQEKDGGIESLREFFPRIAKAYLIGEAADDFARTLGEQVPHAISGTLAAAISAAAADAVEGQSEDGAVVLLSPACASFDQFANFAERGERFRELVQKYVAAETMETA